MRIRFVSLFVLIMLWGPALAHAAAPQPTYLALGDSLAVGVQPNASGTDVPTPYGYADDLYAQLKMRMPTLSLAKLGCSGETTLSMIQGGCGNYPVGSSQLDAAVSFLQNPNNQVVLVTLDIGANDVDGCVTLTTGINQTCVTNGFASVGSNLPVILRELRQAAGPHTPIVAMNYYDPFLAAWALGGSGPALAVESLTAATEFNVILETIYHVFGVPVADVAHAFSTYNFAPIPSEDLPVNVFLIVAWTWMATGPSGPDIHPNAAGYAVIAGAFAKTIGTP